MNIPEDRRYTEEHEWVQVEEGAVRIGITDYAQDALGDVVFVDLPEAGRSVEAGETLAEVESTKSVAEVYAPLAGTVLAANEILVAQPEIINSDPFGEGWFVLIEPADPVSAEAFLSADAYRALTE